MQTHAGISGRRGRPGAREGGTVQLHSSYNTCKEVEPCTHRHVNLVLMKFRDIVLEPRGAEDVFHASCEAAGGEVPPRPRPVGPCGIRLVLALQHATGPDTQTRTQCLCRNFCVAHKKRARALARNSYACIHDSCLF